MRDKKKVLISALLLLSFISGESGVFCRSVSADGLSAPQAVTQLRPSSDAEDKTSGLVQSLIPHAKPSATLQTPAPSTQTENSLGTSGNTSSDISASQSTVVAASNLPSLWNPLNPASANYGKTTPVRDQNPQNLCWAFAGTDAIALSAMSELKITPPALLPAYYDYLSAENAFNNNPKNPLAITLGSTPRQLSVDGNTADYVPDMSIQGYNPASTSAMVQPSVDNPIAQTTFNSLAKTNLHVTDTYKLGGFAPNALPSSTSAILARANQIKQLVYQYGAAQLGVQSEVTLKSSHFDSSTNASYTPYSAVSSDSSLVSTDNGETYLNEDHELLIVGYDDNYSATNFSQNPGMNGAFVVKNSWGSSWGDEGYFYLSYADLYIAGSDIYADKVAQSASNEKIYSATNESPDASGYIIQLDGTSSPVTFTNTYTSQKRGSNQIEQLTSISAYIDQAGITVNVLYKTGGVSTSTSLSSFQNLGSYTFTDAGYQTIPFPAIDLPNASSYTVGIEVTNMSKFNSLIVPIELHSGALQAYPVLTTGDSWVNDGAWENVSGATPDAYNLFLTANSKLVTEKSSATNSRSEKASNLGGTEKVYRVYNPNSGEHFYTESDAEAQNLKQVGWQLEGTGWLSTSLATAQPVYRLYNPNAGYHFYTTSSYEKAALVKAGWRAEGISFRSAGQTPVYRAYNPNNGMHNYTTSHYEQTQLIKLGWKNEGVAWYAES